MPERCCGRIVNINETSPTATFHERVPDATSVPFRQSGTRSRWVTFRRVVAGADDAAVASDVIIRTKAEAIAVFIVSPYS
jgi:hypothetical protein